MNVRSPVAKSDEIGEGARGPFGSVGAGVPEVDETVGLLVRQRCDECRLRDREDRCVGTDTERERDETRGGENRLATQGADADDDVAPDIGPPLASRPPIARSAIDDLEITARRTEVPELPKRELTGVGVRHTSSLKLVDSCVEVKRDLVVNGASNAPPAEANAQHTLDTTEIGHSPSLPRKCSGEGVHALLRCQRPRDEPGSSDFYCAPSAFIRAITASATFLPIASPPNTSKR